MSHTDHAPDARTALTALPVLRSPNAVAFPEMVVTVALESSEAKAVAGAADDDQVVLVPVADGRFARVGSVATIENRGTLPNGTPALTLRVTGRVERGAARAGTGDALFVDVAVVDDVLTDETSSLAARYRALAGSLIDEMGGGRWKAALPDTDHPGALADTIAYWPELTYEQRIELLETTGVDDRLRLATGWAEAALQELQLAKKVRQEVDEGIEKDQREAVLRRQLAAIRKELGDDDGDVLDDYRARLDGLDVADAARAAIGKEIDRLERTGEQSQEGQWIRSWLDAVFEVPWGERTEDNHDLAAARDVLDADHTGLDDVKDRMIEHLAVRKLQEERGVSVDARRRSNAILTLVGPPGVGKTSLGESVASALGRRFVRLALGGIRDEAEIRGHRRTYVGSRPGRLVRALVEAGSMNPVILLDEIDKIGADYRGDPSAALLEVLDPAQNHSFRDHYLEFELDLSDVVFIATANQLETIPPALLDRVEVIRLDGYTDVEKGTIARQHILPRLRERIGLRDDEVVLDDATIERVVADWTREAGVRNLERQLDKLLRKAATTLARGERTAPVTIGADDLTGSLGKPVPRDDLTARAGGPGVATGLAVTGAGGDVLFVETSVMDGDEGLVLTGQLGDVMKESAEIARSYLRANADRLGLTGLDRRLHVHFPSGAVPKDGPSAGITMTTAIASLLSGRPVRSDVAMTGEISLQGKVLPIGGVKQKLLAADRAGISTVIIPQRNGVDLDDVPAEVRDRLDIHTVDEIGEVLDLALESS